MKNENVSYWIGAVQSDGCFKIYTEKKRNKVRHLISFHVSKKSLPMVRKFQIISNKFFKRNSKIFKVSRGNTWEAHIGVSKLRKEFKELDITFGDPPIPPSWTLSDNKYFGAYLAGLIDGDGDIRIKRKNYPQCVIRIAGGHKQAELANAIEEVLGCSVSITRRGGFKELNKRKFYGFTYELEFYASFKNYKFIKEFIIPHLTLKHKKEKLQNFIESRWPR